MKLLSHLPHIKLILPYIPKPSIKLKVYIDTELSLLFGFYEFKIIKLFKEYIKKNNIIFDIGAYIGTYSLLALSEKNVYVHAFEPCLESVKRIFENVYLNKVSTRIKINQMAVADYNGEIFLFLNKSARCNTILNQAKSKEKCLVKCICLDDYCKKNKIIPNFIKIDIEGAASKLLKGALSLIKKEKIIWLIEIHNMSEKNAVLNLFSKEAYKIKKVDNRHWLILPIVFI
ncbi:MAG: FkbM family methyltransferase [Candidatus Helarchaeota archaeon]